MNFFKIIPISKYDPIGILGLALFSLLLSPVFITSFEGITGYWVVSHRLGIEPLDYAFFMQYYIIIAVLISRPWCTLYQFYQRSKHPLVTRLYGSLLLRLTFVLASSKDQKHVYEPMYADWQMELQTDGMLLNGWETLKTNFYYGSWFAWKLWREVGIIRCKQMYKARNAKLKLIRMGLFE